MKAIINSQLLSILFTDDEQVSTDLGSLLEGGTPINDDGDDLHFVAVTLECNHFYCWRMKDMDGTLLEPDDENEALNRFCQLRFDSVSEAVEAANGDWGIGKEDLTDYVIVRFIEEGMGSPF